MKKIILNSSLIMALCFGFVACESQKKETDAIEIAEEQNEEKIEATENASTEDAADKMEDAAEFAVNAANSGIFEVEAGRLAMQKAQSSSVKNFAKQMVNDHSQANKELKELAAKENITLPTSMSNEHKEKLDKLSKLKGADFDEEYMSLMDENHEKSVNMFETVAENKNADPDIKAFAAKTLPKLRMHAELADAKKEIAEEKDIDTIGISKKNRSEAEKNTHNKH